MNVDSGGHYSVNRLVELLGGDVVHVPNRPGEPDYCTFADIGKIKRFLGWTRRRPLRKELARCSHTSTIGAMRPCGIGSRSNRQPSHGFVTLEMKARMAESQTVAMALNIRSAALYSVINSTQVTDALGNRLDTEASILQILDILRDLRRRKGSLYLVDNGGSAAVASHIVTDCLNVARLRATTLHDSSLITCMANDYG